MVTCFNERISRTEFSDAWHNTQLSFLVAIQDHSGIVVLVIFLQEQRLKVDFWKQ